MAANAGDAMARLGAALCKVGNKAQSLKALLARLVILHGMPFVQNLAKQLARLVQHLQRTVVAAQYRLRTVVPLESLERIIGRLSRRAVAALLLALNSHAFSVAARQLITISLSSSQDGNSSEQAYSCHVRLLGGLLWLQFGLRSSGFSAAVRGPAEAQPGTLQIAATCTEPARTAEPMQECDAQGTQQAEDGTCKRHALVTSSTESFKSGLASYAQLHSGRLPHCASIAPRSAKSQASATPAGHVSAPCPCQALPQPVQSAPAWLASPISPGDEDVEGPCPEAFPGRLADTGASCAPPRPLQEVPRLNPQAVLARADLPMPPKAPVSPRHEAVSGASRILAARPALITPGQPTPDFFGGLRKLARAHGFACKKAGAREQPAGSCALLASPDDSTGSSASASGSVRAGRSGQTHQGVPKENVPWR